MLSVAIAHCSDVHKYGPSDYRKAAYHQLVLMSFLVACAQLFSIYYMDGIMALVACVSNSHQNLHAL